MLTACLAAGSRRGQQKAGSCANFGDKGQEMGHLEYRQPDFRLTLQNSDDEEHEMCGCKERDEGFEKRRA
ncbi:unnamed protein product [Protopolystoma xenopodis]|uniref:Uncharacterized protein n=1 Tax=Protopolystoma xenopodis TaxID=117903 RepID=A0A3S5ARQ7_9PLAT|nr:unnamed protein product [Protopolystoma xenopodis]